MRVSIDIYDRWQAGETVVSLAKEMDWPVQTMRWRLKADAKDKGDSLPSQRKPTIIPFKRVLILLEENDLKWLDDYCCKHNKNRSEIIREILAELKEKDLKPSAT